MKFVTKAVNREAFKWEVKQIQLLQGELHLLATGLGKYEFGEEFVESESLGVKWKSTNMKASLFKVNF